MVVAAFTAVRSAVQFGPGGLLEAIFFFLCGVGVGQRSLLAAVGVLLGYSANTVFLVKMSGPAGFSVVRILVTALLIANLRAVWLAQQLRAYATEPPPERLDSSFSEWFSDRMPVSVWPWARWIFYPVAVTILFGVIAILFCRRSNCGASAAWSATRGPSAVYGTPGIPSPTRGSLRGAAFPRVDGSRDVGGA